MLYKYLPISVGLRKLVFYKRHDLHLLKQRPAPDAGASLAAGEGSLFPSYNLPATRTAEETPLISYVLLCECLSLSESILTSVCAVIDQLRARCCGYSALYVNVAVHE